MASWSLPQPHGPKFNLIRHSKSHSELQIDTSNRYPDTHSDDQFLDLSVAENQLPAHVAQTVQNTDDFFE